MVDDERKILLPTRHQYTIVAAASHGSDRCTRLRSVVEGLTGCNALMRAIIIVLGLCSNMLQEEDGPTAEEGGPPEGLESRAVTDGKWAPRSCSMLPREQLTAFPADRVPAVLRQ